MTQLTISTTNLLAQSKTNSLKGRVYRHLIELKELKNYYGARSTVISNTDRISETNFGLVELKDTLSRNYVIILEEFIHDPNDPRRPKYLILDTLTIKYSSEEQIIFLNECDINDKYRPGIIAFGKVTPKTDFTSKIIQAWYVDFKEKLIYPLKDKSKLKCSNPDGGC